MRRSICIIASIAMLVFFVPQSALADLYWETVTETSGMPEMPKGLPKQVLEQIKSQYKADNKPEISKTWMTAHAMRMESSNNIMIMDFKDLTMYSIDPKTKSYFKSDIRKTAEMMGQGDNEIKIQPTKEKQKISGYDCTKYVETSAMMGKTIYWVSTDVKEYKELKAINDDMKEVFEKDPKLKASLDRIYSIDKLGGWPIRTIRDMMGVTTTSTVQNIKSQKADAALFEVPKEYKEKPSPMMEMLKKKRK